MPAIMAVRHSPVLVVGATAVVQRKGFGRHELRVGYVLQHPCAKNGGRCFFASVPFMRGNRVHRVCGPRLKRHRRRMKHAAEQADAQEET